MIFDIIIIGGGISGATLAERYATVLGKKVLLIEKRNHLGGNCYDYFDQAGILVPKYGPHFFHTDFPEVWKYVHKFSGWTPYRHKVLSNVDGKGKLVPVPVNITTVNLLFNLKIKNSGEMKTWLRKNTSRIKKIRNSEESALNRVGENLYRILFKNYTKKHWNLWPKQLNPEVLNRIPVKTDFNDEYFPDRYQGMPKYGYHRLFGKMLGNPKIKVMLKTDYFKIRNKIKGFEKLFFTGPIDRYFNYSLGSKLQYRSMRFEYETLNREYFQPVAVVNYPNTDKYTRITEPKHATGQLSKMTTIIREYASWEGEPYYPVPSENNLELYKKYQSEAKKLEKKGIYFVGRLANYKYFNMDQAFKNSLDLFYKLEKGSV